jgi:hypothetical protein
MEPWPKNGTMKKDGTMKEEWNCGKYYIVAGERPQESTSPASHAKGFSPYCTGLNSFSRLFISGCNGWN